MVEATQSTLKAAATNNATVARQVKFYADVTQAAVNEDDVKFYASKDAYGLVKIGDGLEVADGVLSACVQTANTKTYSFGDGLYASEDGDGNVTACLCYYMNDFYLCGGTYLALCSRGLGRRLIYDVLDTYHFCIDGETCRIYINPGILCKCMSFSWNEPPYVAGSGVFLNEPSSTCTHNTYPPYCAQITAYGLFCLTCQQHIALCNGHVYFDKGDGTGAISANTDQFYNFINALSQGKFDSIMNS